MDKIARVASLLDRLGSQRNKARGLGVNDPRSKFRGWSESMGVLKAELQNFLDEVGPLDPNEMAELESSLGQDGKDCLKVPEYVSMLSGVVRENRNMVVKLNAQDLKALVESVAKETKKPAAQLTVEGLRKIIREEAKKMMSEGSHAEFYGMIDKGAKELAARFEGKVKHKWLSLEKSFENALGSMANTMERLAHYGPGRGYDVDREERMIKHNLVGNPEDVQAALDAVREIATEAVKVMPMIPSPETVYPPGSRRD